MKKIIYLVAAFLCLSCSDDHESNPQNRGASGSVTEVTPVTSDLCVELTTDKAFYKPNETVTFTAADALPAGTKVRYLPFGRNSRRRTGQRYELDMEGSFHRFQRIHGRTLPAGKRYGRHRRYDCGRCIQPSGVRPDMASWQISTETRQKRKHWKRWLI